MNISSATPLLATRDFYVLAAEEVLILARTVASRRPSTPAVIPTVQFTKLVLEFNTYFHVAPRRFANKRLTLFRSDFALFDFRRDYA